MSSVDALEAPSARYITIPYTPRRHFIPIHSSHKRFIWLCAHRRAGKTVCLINALIKAALTNQRREPPPRYAYIAPSFAQAKDLTWGYIKQYCANIPGMSYSESELYAEFPNGARITLYGGSSAYERIRGLYLDGAVLDEYELLHPSCFSAVVRPALSDRAGFCIVSGTPAGYGQFLLLREVAEANTHMWDIFTIPVCDTDALDPAEVELARQSMTKSDFAREYMCSFDAAVSGAYYEDQIEFLHLHNRITDVPYQTNAAMFTAWDLGLDDETAIIFFQMVGKEIHFVDYEYGTNKGLDYYADIINSKPYHIAGHILPHDVEAREISSGKSRKEVLEALLPNQTIYTCPMHKVEDGITAVRGMLSISYFDKVKMKRAVACLAAYQSVVAEKLGSNKSKPLHNYASHTADAFRMAAMGMHLVTPWSGARNGSGFGGALKRLIKGIV